MRTGRNYLVLLALFVSFAVTLFGCGGSGRGMGATADPLPMRPPDTGAAMALAGVLKESNSPPIAQLGARFPPPDAVTCQALTIGCEGGLGPIHYGPVREYDFSEFDYRERRRGVSLAERTGVSREGDEMTGHRALAGWMDYSLFVIETPLGHRGGIYGKFSMGTTTGSDADVLVNSTATWSGVMFGLRVSDPDVFVHGDALVTVSNPDGDSELLVDVEFTNIKDKDTGAGLNDVSWNGLELKDGSFGIDPAVVDSPHTIRHPGSIGISGRFYGSNHEEVGGIFSFGPGVSGAFGAKRD